MPDLDVKIILVRPRNPLNIGACARAMANFGFRRLAVVAPYAPVWREISEDNETAFTSAVGARDVIASAEVHTTLAEALADRELVLATTAMHNRAAERTVVMLPDLVPFIQSKWPTGRDLKIGVIFGPEKTGLTSRHIAHAQAILTIPTCDQTPSMNLGQSTAVCCYELSKAAAASAPKRIQGEEPEMPTHAEIEATVLELDEMCIKIGFQSGMNAQARQERTRRTLFESGLKRHNLFLIRAIASRIVGKNRPAEEEK